MADYKERTFIMIKPDGVQRGLVGKIIQRFEDKGFKLVAMKMNWAPEEMMKQHYVGLSSEPFFPSLVKYMCSGPVVPMIWEGLNAVKTGRVMVGETGPKDSAPGSIRGDFCIVSAHSYVSAVRRGKLNPVKNGRIMLNESNLKDSTADTARSESYIMAGRNVIHGSDSVESANKEIKLWFGDSNEKKQVFDWTSGHEKWIYE